LTKICQSSANGSQQTYSVQGNIKAELPTILKKLTDIGISGVGNYTEEHYENVLQSQLADVMKDVIHCKENTFNLLFQTFLAPQRQSSLLSARLVFDRLEPKEEPNLKAMTFPTYFKNIGQSAARQVEAKIYPLLQTAGLSVVDEDKYFSYARNTPSAIINVDIQPGQSVYFLAGIAITDSAWVNYTSRPAGNKQLYLMSTLTYLSEDLSNNEKIVTETCLIFSPIEVVSRWHYCLSGHNTTYKMN
jgi:hypothetical protein